MTTRISRLMLMRPLETHIQNDYICVGCGAIVSLVGKVDNLLSVCCNEPYDLLSEWAQHPAHLQLEQWFEDMPDVTGATSQQQAVLIARVMSILLPLIIVMVSGLIIYKIVYP